MLRWLFLLLFSWCSWFECGLFGPSYPEVVTGWGYLWSWLCFCFSSWILYKLNCCKRFRLETLTLWETLSLCSMGSGGQDLFCAFTSTLSMWLPLFTTCVWGLRFLTEPKWTTRGSTIFMARLSSTRRTTRQQIRIWSNSGRSRAIWAETILESCLRLTWG